MTIVGEDVLVLSPPLSYPKGDKRSSVFLAGGIVGCPNWQDDAVELWGNVPAILLNPRHRDFPINDPDAAEAQIKWEHDHLAGADAVLFWFAKETIQPIVLFELGRWSGRKRPIFVGCHPEYPRRQDVVIQLKLECPFVAVVDSLEDVVDQARSFITDLDRHRS